MNQEGSVNRYTIAQVYQITLQGFQGCLYPLAGTYRQLYEGPVEAGKYQSFHHNYSYMV